MKLAFAVHDLGPSDLSLRLLTEGNRWVQEGVGNDLAVFYQEAARPPLTPFFSSCHLAEGWAYDGAVVATSFRTAELLLRFPSPRRKAFLAWDLDWLRDQYDFRRLRAVYGNPDLTIIARCEDHAKALSRCWNRGLVLTKGFDLRAIAEVMR